MTTAAGNGLAAESVRFLAVGVSATAVHYAIMACLASLCGVPALWASQGGFAAGGLLSYAMNRWFTFRAVGAHAAAVPRYLAACMVGWCVNGAALAGLQAALGRVWVAQLGASAAVAVVSFLLQRQFVFAATKRRGTEGQAL